MDVGNWEVFFFSTAVAHRGNIHIKGIRVSEFEVAHPYSSASKQLKLLKFLMSNL